MEERAGTCDAGTSGTPLVAETTLLEALTKQQSRGEKGVRCVTSKRSRQQPLHLPRLTWLLLLTELYLRQPSTENDCKGSEQKTEVEILTLSGPAQAAVP